MSVVQYQGAVNRSQSLRSVKMRTFNLASRKQAQSRACNRLSRTPAAVSHIVQQNRRVLQRCHVTFAVPAQQITAAQQRARASTVVAAAAAAVEKGAAVAQRPHRYAFTASIVLACCMDSTYQLLAVASSCRSLLAGTKCLPAKSHSHSLQAQSLELKILGQSMLSTVTTTV